jgi:hypothetical protein
VAIRDALWACPACRSFGAIRRSDREERCSQCRARFDRTNGANIRMRTMDGRASVRTLPDWEALLPPVDQPPEGGVLGPQNALVRTATPAVPVHASGVYIGMAERFEPARPATVTLDARRLVIREHDGREAIWPLEDITAVQPSSATLQVAGAGHPLTSIRFTDDSVRRWEALLHNFIRSRCRDVGRGEITEFHPRIRYA